VLAISQLFNAVGVRNLDRSIFAFNHINNPVMILAFAVGFSLQIAVTEIPVLTGIFGTAELSLQEWVLLTALAAVPLAVHEFFVLGRWAHARLRQG
jgi:Ca2+-transporting ATPase